MLVGCCAPRKRASKKPWTKIESTPETRSDILLEQLLEMYWTGVRLELTNILLTLHRWSWDSLASVTLEDENDYKIYGFETFIDQVCEGPRRLASSHANELYRTGRSRYTSINKDTAPIIDAIKDNLDRKKHLNIFERRARFLDIDKLVEYRPPPIESLWKTPRIPQLTLADFDNYSMPNFKPLPCSACRNVIRGIMFRCAQANCQAEKKLNSGDLICEDCYREGRHPQGHMAKLYKHIVLHDAIKPDVSRKICHCSSVPRSDSTGKPLNLFPVDPSLRHRATGGAKCGLLQLGDRIGEAKLEGVSLEIVRRKKEEEENQVKESQKRFEHRRATQAAAARNNLRQGRPTFSEGPVGATEEQEGILEDQTDKDVPFHLRMHLKKFPLGNVHVGLMVGTLIFENGVRSSNGGAYISCRDPLQFQVLRECGEEVTKTLSINPERELFSSKRDNRGPRRLKACMKQVVGGAFSGWLDSDLETDIIKSLISESKKYKDDARISQSVRDRKLNEAVDRLLIKTKQLLKPRILRFLKIIIKKLLCPDVKLKWHKRKNNCQNFCDAIIDHDRFGPLFGESTMSSESQFRTEEPLYLMSFVCRPGSYTEATPRAKFDVPNGLAEEYLLKFRYGRHDDADIVDTLQEYWHDWGGFGKNLYRYQDLFPWDCTEAFGRNPQKCNESNISKHVWSFPFDSWSIIQLHLQKDRRLYPAPIEQNDPYLSDRDWMHNRLELLLAQDVLLSAAVEMACSSALRNSTTWLHRQTDPRRDRYKLGGILRAQPWSHQYEQGQYHEYFIAGWAHLRLEDQIRAYESLRDFKQALPEIPQSWADKWHKGFDLRDDPFHFYPGWYGDLLWDFMNIGLSPDGLDQVHTYAMQYNEAIGDIGLGNIGSIDGLGPQDGRNTDSNFLDHSLPGGHLDHGYDLDNVAHSIADGNFHANVGQNDDTQNHLGGLGPSLRGDPQDPYATVNWDSTSSLLGSHHSHPGYNTMSGLGSHGGAGHPGFGFGIMPMGGGRRGRSGLGFGFTFTF